MADPTTQAIISSLTREKAKQIVQRYGVQTVLAGMQAWSQYRSGKASKQQQLAFEAMENAIPELLNRIEPKEIIVMPNAFNSSSVFNTKFQTAALVTIALGLLEFNNAIKRVGSSMEAIRNELAMSNVAIIQGWQNDGFGSHVYRFVRNEMLQVLGYEQNNGEKQHHYFYVWHPDTDWYPIFEEKNREAPLGTAFGGYHQHLDVICLRMRTDRETLNQETSWGPTAKFHLLIPAYGPVVIDAPIGFHRSLLPLRITGQTHRQVNFAWLNLVWKPQELELQCVSILKNSNPVAAPAALTFVTCWVGCLASGVACTVFPPCAPAAATAFASCWAGGAASWATLLGGFIYEATTSGAPRLLGDPLFIAEET